MKWETVRLGDIADFRNGINFGKEAYGKGVQLIGVSNFGDRLFPDYKSLDEVKENVVRGSDYLCSGDIVFVRSNGNKGLVGRCLLIDSPQDKVTYSGFCIRARIKDVSKHYPLFWTYHFKDKAFRKAMSGTAVGANIQNLSQERLAAYEANIPDYKSQVRIADILFSYDKLIENNQKQIKLLEEAAQRLYKEWFVDLRFPGHENVKIVNGVPEGWSKTNLFEIAPIVTGKKDANFGAADGKYPFFTCAQEPIKAPSYSFDCDAVILAGNGDFNVKLYRGQFEAYQRTYVFSPYSSENIYLLYYAVKDNMRQLFQGASGSTIKFLTKRMLDEILVSQPNGEVLSSFNKICKVFQKKIEILRAKILLAQEARDRLLTKFMSGELEV